MSHTLEIVKIQKPQDANIIIGQAHFIKTVEDVYEALVGCVPQIKFGLAFCEASGVCKVRCEGTDEGLKKTAAQNAMNVGAGHAFFVLLDGTFPINVLNAIKNVPEVCSIYCATANPLEIVVVQTQQGRGILGVIDGASPQGIENETDIAWRKDFLRKIGYKR
jgi:adenosine/AMP kinase